MCACHRPQGEAPLIRFQPPASHIIAFAASETEQDPMGLLGTEAFCPLFLVCREEMPASMAFPGFQRTDTNSC